MNTFCAREVGYAPWLWNSLRTLANLYSSHRCWGNMQVLRCSCGMSFERSLPVSCKYISNCTQLYFRDRDSSVGIATCYELDGLGIESQWGVKFSTPVQTGPGAHPDSYAMGSGFFGGKSGLGVAFTTPPSSAEVKGRVELYLYSPSGPSWSVLERTLFQPYSVFTLLITIYLYTEMKAAIFWGRKVPALPVPSKPSCNGPYLFNSTQIVT